MEKHPSEINFTKCPKFKDSKISYPTTRQDMFEHWDCKIDNIKYDVKAQKKIKRSDDAPSTTHTYVEYINVRGNKGWIYGKADKIAFEIEDNYIIVDRKDLLHLCNANITEEDYSLIYNQPMEYKFYRRKGRKDKILLVPIDDLLAISEELILKD